MTSKPMPVEPAVIAAQNQRKIEKDKRRKNYHDSQVQGTNNSSIVSKRSVEMIYSSTVDGKENKWFKYFVPNAKRRSPAINRGYWIRMESIKEMVLRILDQYAGKVRVVNLGCGFDPFPFQMLSETQGKFDFYDFDYPELVQRKLKLIRQAKELLDVIGPEVKITQTSDALGVVMASDSYKLVGCDLKDTTLYQKQVDALLVGDLPTIFIAEVSLAYMKPEHANPVVEILASLPNSHFLVLEQIMPAGEEHFFAQKMLYHFDHLRSPLQCVETYSTKEKQCARFKQYYPHVEISDLFECWNSLVSREKKELVHRVEDFDEWEEFIVFCQHYVVIHARNGGADVWHKDTEPTPAVPESNGLVLEPIPGVQLKFPSACVSNEEVYIHGGLFQSRSDELCRLTSEGPEVIAKGPSARMCHTLTDLQDGRLLLVGGRTRPGDILSDIWLFDTRTSTWSAAGDFPVPVSRHSAVPVSPGVVLIFAQGRFFHANVSLHVTIEEVTTSGTSPQVDSCGFCFDAESRVGYIVGGKSDSVGPAINNGLFRFTVGDTVAVELVRADPHFCRIGCIAFMSGTDVVVVGGAGARLLDARNTIIAVDATGQISTLPILQHVWRTAPVWLGSVLAGDCLVGGGAVCYSFGSSYSGAYRVHCAAHA